jgi:predicted ATP-dependent protease
MIYYAITSNQVWDLGVQLSPGNADHYAVNQFNIHQAQGGYLIVNRAELKEIVRSGLKRLESKEA